MPSYWGHFQYYMIWVLFKLSGEYLIFLFQQAQPSWIKLVVSRSQIPTSIQWTVIPTLVQFSKPFFAVLVRYGPYVHHELLVSLGREPLSVLCVVQLPKC